MKMDMFPKLKVIKENIFFLMIIITVVFTGCGSSKGENNIADAPSQAQDMDFMNIHEEEVSGDYEASIQKQEDIISGAGVENEAQELTLGDDGSMEIYSGGDSILLSDDMLVGQVVLEDILQGNPFLYDRFKTDGFVFE